MIKLIRLNLITAALLVGLASAMVQAAEPRDMDKQVKAMEKLAFLLGLWDGQVALYLPDGSTSRYRSTDEIRYLNNGTVLMITGTKWAPGAAANDDPVSEHTALINYDEHTDRYDLRSYFSGEFASGHVEYVGPDGARWMIDGEGIQMRFHILNEGPDSWKEKAEMSTDGGASWVPAMDISFLRRH